MKVATGYDGEAALLHLVLLLNSYNSDLHMFHPEEPWEQFAHANLFLQLHPYEVARVQQQPMNHESYQILRE